MGTNTVFRFDLCDVINCAGNPSAWKAYEVYLCDSYPSFVSGPPDAHHLWCGRWEMVLWETGPCYESNGGYVKERPRYAMTHSFQKWHEPLPEEG